MYLDPAFGGMILQIVLALIVVGGTMIFAMRRKIRLLFIKKQDDVYTNQSVVTHNVSDDGVVDTLAD